MFANSLNSSDNSNIEKYALFDVNLKIKKGEIIAVIGGTGKGKSALLKCIIGELYPVSKQQIINNKYHSLASPVSSENKVINPDFPCVKLNDYPGYFDQNSWLNTGTIKECILFGREFNETIFEDVINTSAPSLARQTIRCSQRRQR